MKIKMLKRKRKTLQAQVLCQILKRLKLDSFVIWFELKYWAYNRDLQYNYFGEAENFLVTVEWTMDFIIKKSNKRWTINSRLSLSQRSSFKSCLIWKCLYVMHCGRVLFFVLLHFLLKRDKIIVLVFLGTELLLRNQFYPKKQIEVVVHILK